MKEVQIGGRFSDTGLSMFGIEEVNDLLKQGFTVKELKGGGAIFHKLGTNGDENVRMALAGFMIKVFLTEPE